MIENIVERFVIHFFASTSLVLLSYFGLRFARRKWAWIAEHGDLVTAALVVFAISTLREAYDVANGQPLIKAFTDYASWLLGCGVSVWLLYRFGKWFER